MATSPEAKTEAGDFEARVELVHNNIQSLGRSFQRLVAYNENPELYQRVLRWNMGDLNAVFRGKYSDVQNVEIDVRIEALNRYEESVENNDDVQATDRAGYEVLTLMLVVELAEADSRLLDLESDMSQEKMAADELSTLISSFPLSVHERYFDKINSEWERAQKLANRQRKRLDAMQGKVDISTPHN